MPSITFKKINEQRIEAGMSINELCRRTGMHKSTYSRWRRGLHMPTGKIAEKVIDAVKKGCNAAE